MTVSYINLMKGEEASDAHSSDIVAARHNLVWQRYGEGVTPEEIAEEVGMTSNHVRKILLDNGESTTHAVGGVDSIWELEPNQRRIAFARRAQRGARKALGLRDRLPKPIPITAPSAVAPEASAAEPVSPLMPAWLRIVHEVAARYDVAVKDITGPSRSRKIASARHEAVWRVREETSLSLSQIGKRFGRDHTTILHSYRTHAERLAKQGSAQV